MIELSKTQLNHYDSLMWLFDNLEGVGVGRSTLVAKILIDLAIKYPGREIYVSDLQTLPLFGNHPMINRNFLRHVLFPMLKSEKQLIFNESKNTIIYKPKNG